MILVELDWFSMQLAARARTAVGRPGFKWSALNL